VTLNCAELLFWIQTSSSVHFNCLWTCPYWSIVGSEIWPETLPCLVNVILVVNSESGSIFRNYIFLTKQLVWGWTSEAFFDSQRLDYGLDGSGIECRRGRDFPRSRPDRPWAPPNLLYSGYRVFHEGKTVGAWRWPPSSSSAEAKERVDCTSTPSLGLHGLFQDELYLYLGRVLASRPVVGPTQRSVQWVLAALSPELIRPDRVAEVKNEWAVYTSMVCTETARFTDLVIHLYFFLQETYCA